VGCFCPVASPTAGSAFAGFTSAGKSSAAKEANPPGCAEASAFEHLFFNNSTCSACQGIKSANAPWKAYPPPKSHKHRWVLESCLTLMDQRVVNCHAHGEDHHFASQHPS
jgi:hypothetical protein